jgi:CMP-N-acetylneuraminic acid synthetase
MKTIGLVPMKGHSERVPGKNLKLFHGKPLFYYVINSLLQSGEVDEVCVNTDSKELAGAVLELFPQVRIIDRPEAIQGDFVSMNKIIEHDLEQTDADLYLQSHSTNPLLRAETVAAAVRRFKQLLREGQKDSLFSVTRLQTRLYDKAGEPINHSPSELLRTQDLPPVFEENSNFYIFTKDSFSASDGKRIGLRPEMFEIDKIEAVDIDEPQDFKIAEAICKAFVS